MNQSDEKVLLDFKKDEKVTKFVQLLELKARAIKSIKENKFSELFYYIAENYSKKLSGYVELQREIYKNPTVSINEIKKLVKKKNDLVFHLIKEAKFI